MITKIINATAHTLHLTPQATTIGLTCLSAQLLLTLLFDKRTNILPNGPWSTLPAFTAHQIIAFPSMIFLTYRGWKEWEFEQPYNSSLSAHDRIFGEYNENDLSLAYGTGAVLLWDIPAGIFAPSLRDGLMFCHHVGMFAVAAVMSGYFSNGRMIGYYYTPFYFGVIETSSVFLSVVDQFHPKRVSWYNWLNCKENQERPLVVYAKKANDLCRVLFALSYLVYRGVYFPFTSFFHSIPDVWNAYRDVPEGVPIWTGYFMIMSLVLFSALQAYWGLLVARQVKNTLFGGGGKKDKKKKT